MSSILINNLPPELYEFLKKEANKNSTEISELVINLLKKYFQKQIKKRKLSELKGLGKDIWKNIDIEKFIENERNLWS